MLLPIVPPVSRENRGEVRSQPRGALEAGEGATKPFAVRGVAPLHEETEAHHVLDEVRGHQRRSELVPNLPGPSYKRLLLGDARPLRGEKMEPDVVRIVGEETARLCQGPQTGAVFHDGLGTLAETRGLLTYYPYDIWLHLLAAQWARISQQEPFVGRTGEVGDELGSALMAADLVQDVMRLGFLMERRYAPYSKWFGSAFARLECASRLRPHLAAVLSAHGWHDRQQHLVRAYEIIAAMHNDLGITEPLSTETSRFHGRPFLIIHADRFADAIRNQIQ